MRFLVDECCGPVVAKWLREQGYDVCSVAEELFGVDDDVIITKAGPGTIMEAAALERKLIITGAVGLQEAGNIDFVLTNKLGTHCPKQGDAARGVTRLVGGTADGLSEQTCQTNLQQFAGTHYIAKVLLDGPTR